VFDQEMGKVMNDNNGNEKPWIVRIFTKPNATDWVIVILTVGIVLVGYWQWKTMKGQLKEMQNGGVDTHALAVQAEKQATNTNTLALEAGRQADAAKTQAYNTAESLRRSDEAFRISERPYITFGRKDGVLAEITETKDPTQWPTMTLYLQNAGHLPAQNVCVSTLITATPIFKVPAEQNQPLIRQRGLDGQGHMQTLENACPTIGGDSAYAHLITKFFPQETLDRVRAEKSSDFRLSVVIQYCDPFGRYCCKNASFQYIGDNLRELGELDCGKDYGSVPDLPPGIYGNNEPLPPCIGGDKPREDELMRVVRERVRRSRKHT
jgi:hypothetical protein